MSYYSNSYYGFPQPVAYVSQPIGYAKRTVWVQNAPTVTHHVQITPGIKTVHNNIESGQTKKTYVSARGAEAELAFNPGEVQKNCYIVDGIKYFRQ